MPSGFWKAAGLSVLTALIVAILGSAVSKDKKNAVAEVMNSIERSIIVCENTMVALRVEDAVNIELQQYVTDIKRVKKTEDKAHKAVDMTEFTIKYCDASQSLAEELYSVRTGILQSLKVYEAIVNRE